MNTVWNKWVLIAMGAFVAMGCETTHEPQGGDSGPVADAGRVDSGRVDSGRVDSGRVDSGSEPDASALADAGAPDATIATDAGTDAGEPDVDETVTEGDWTMTPSLTTSAEGMVQGHVTFVRLGGAETRGGGVCVLRLEGSPCTVDSDCPDFPTGGVEGGHVYCASHGGSESMCWLRPGDNCYRNPANTPGTYSTTMVLGAGTWTAIGCMANEATPMGCGSGDPSNYVRATSRLIVVP